MAFEMEWISHHETLSDLPPEILHNILTHLSIPGLVSFAQTSKSNYFAAGAAFKTLHLSVLPRRIHGILAFLNTSTWDPDDTGYQYDFDMEGSMSQINYPTATQDSRPLSRSSATPPPETVIPTNQVSARLAATPSPRVHRKQQIETQNVTATRVMSSSILTNLQSLTLHLYELTSTDLVTVLATKLPHLQNLHLNFSHPYIHDSCLPSAYFRVPPKGTPVWNGFAGIGGSPSVMRLQSLRSLTIERAGLTSVQLQKWIELNPRLSHIKLKNVTGVDVDFVNWLGSIYNASTPTQQVPVDNHYSFNGIDARPPPRRILKTLQLESCSNLKLQTQQDFTAFLPALLPDLSKLSFNSCQDVNSSELIDFVSTWQEQNYHPQSSSLNRSKTVSYLDVDVNMDDDLVVITPDHRQRSRRVRNGHRSGRNMEANAVPGSNSLSNIEVSPSLSAVDAPIAASSSFASGSLLKSTSLFTSGSLLDFGSRLPGEISMSGTISAPTSMPSTPEDEIDEFAAMKGVSVRGDSKRRAL